MGRLRFRDRVLGALRERDKRRECERTKSSRAATAENIALNQLETNVAVSHDTSEPTQDNVENEVLTTVVDLGDIEIKVSVNDDLHLLTVSGPYSPRIIPEINKITRRCTGSIGLEFRPAKSAADKNPRPFQFDHSALKLLNQLKAQCNRNGTEFLLCSPPARLEEFLRLSGVYDKYRIAGTETTAKAEDKPKSKPKPKPAKRRQRRPQFEVDPEQDPNQTSRRIYQLNTSLKRTANLEKELDSAEKCVMKFLPEKPPTVPGYNFAFSYKSSEKVGGDFFDFIWLDEKRMGVSIGDVSGHGIDAALVMGISKKLINIRAKDDRFPLPSEVLKQVNIDVSPDLNRQTFVTALYGILNVETGDFLYARAGHEEPIFHDGAVHSIASTGVALGLGIEKYFNAQIEDVAVTLTPGSFLLLTTDGISECRNMREAIYTRERLAFECTQLRGGNAEETLAHLLEKVSTFADGRSQEDDMTAIMIERPHGSAIHNSRQE